MRNNYFRSVKLAVVLPFFNASLFEASASAQQKVGNFGLKDQNNKYTEVNFPSDRVVILIFGDRKGAGQIDGWSNPIYKELSDSVYIFGVASLSGVPSYARGLVRRLIKRQTSVPVLLDWGGNVSKTFEYQKDKALLVVVDKNGSVITSRSGPATTAEVDAVLKEIKKLL